MAHDAPVGEYGGIVAALATLVVSLTTAFASVGALPALDSKATAAVAAAAKAKHVSGAEARAAYAKAPYRKPVLRYLYAMSWVGAASDKASATPRSCSAPIRRSAAAAAIRRSPKLLARLRAAHVTVSQASTAIGRGMVDGCG